MITKWSTNFIKIRHNGVIPIPLRQLLKSYFNVSDVAIDNVINYSGITLLDILNATVVINDIRERYNVYFTDTILQGIEMTGAFNRSGGVTPPQWEIIKSQANEFVFSDDSYLISEGYLDAYDGVITVSKNGDGYITLKALEDMGVWERVTPAEYLDSSLNYLTDEQRQEFETRHGAGTFNGQAGWDMVLMKRDSFPICFGADVWIPKQFAEFLEPQLESSYTKYIFQNYWAFWGGKIMEIMNDSKFSKARITTTPKSGSVGRGSVNTVTATVYLLHRTNSNLDVRVIELTPFIQNLSTTVSDGGGSFSISYKDVGAIRAPDTIEEDKITKKKTKKNKDGVNRPMYDSGKDTGIQSGGSADKKDNKWFKRGLKIAKPKIVKGIADKEVRKRGAQNADGKNGEFHSVENLFYSAKNADGENVDRVVPPFIHQQCNPQDIILIKFETLKGELEGGAMNKFVGKLVSLTELFPIVGESASSRYLFGKNTYWDMIGLVDTSQMSTPSNTGEFSGTITGKCLSKLFEIDQNIFYAGAGDNVSYNTKKGQFESYRSHFFLNGDVANKHPAFYRMFTAMRIGGELQDIAFLKLESVAFWTNYIVEKMAKIAIIRDDAVWDGDMSMNSGISISASAGKPTPTTNDDQRWKETARGIWKIVENVVDEQVKNLILNDLTLANSTDSIKGMLEQVVQAPFVEQIWDTYDNRFNIITRIPPFTRSAYKDNFTYEVENDHLISFNVSKETEAYSWFRVKPIFLWGGGSDNYDFFSPTVFFGEFADVFGNSPYEVTSPYLDYGANNDKFEIGWTQAVDQLAWLVETHGHLPFTRRGTITLTGDRTVKKGMNLYLSATDELFYIDSVDQSLMVGKGSASRTTTVSVSRGMVLSHYDKYFDLINTDVEIYKQTKYHPKFGEQTFENETAEDVDRGNINWHVDKEIFSFLLDGEQFVNAGTDGSVGGFRKIGQTGGSKVRLMGYPEGLDIDGVAPPPQADPDSKLKDKIRKAHEKNQEALDQQNSLEEQFEKENNERLNQSNPTPKGGHHRNDPEFNHLGIPLKINFDPLPDDTTGTGN